MSSYTATPPNISFIEETETQKKITCLLSLASIKKNRD